MPNITAATRYPTSNCVIGDERPNSERSYRDDPVDHGNQNAVKFLEKLQDEVDSLIVLLPVENTAERNSESTDEENNSGKVGIDKCRGDVRRDKLREGALVNNITKRDLLGYTA
jgi:hypothetical protein